MLWPWLWWVVGFDLPCAKSGRGWSSYGFLVAESWCLVFGSAGVNLHCVDYVQSLVFVLLECEMTWCENWRCKRFALKVVSVFSTHPTWNSFLYLDLLHIFARLIPGQRIPSHQHESDITRVTSCTRASIDSHILTIFFCLPCRTREGG